MQQNLGSNIKWGRAKNAVAAGTSNGVSDAIDTAGYRGCLIIIAWGAITASGAQSNKLSQNQDGGVTVADLEGSAVTVLDTDDNKLVIYDVREPLERYLFAHYLRATQNSAIDGIFYALYNGRNAPAVNDATTVKSLTRLVSPAEGTA